MLSSPGIGMHVEIRDPDDKTILSKVYSSDGRFSFTSHSPGEHVICLYSNSSKWFSGSQLRVHLDIQVGEHAVDYGSVAQKEKLTELQLRVRQLLDQVDQITKEQNYQRVSATDSNMGLVTSLRQVFSILNIFNWPHNNKTTSAPSCNVLALERFRGKWTKQNKPRVSVWDTQRLIIFIQMLFRSSFFLSYVS